MHNAIPDSGITRAGSPFARLRIDTPHDVWPNQMRAGHSSPPAIVERRLAFRRVEGAA